VELWFAKISTPSFLSLLQPPPLVNPPPLNLILYLEHLQISHHRGELSAGILIGSRVESFLIVTLLTCVACKVNGKACVQPHPLYSQQGGQEALSLPQTLPQGQWLPIFSCPNAKLWLVELREHNNRLFLSDGILHGFQLSPFPPAHATNYKSATYVSAKAAVEQVIAGEFAEGNYISKFKPIIISTLGAPLSMIVPVPMGGPLMITQPHAHSNSKL